MKTKLAALNFRGRGFRRGAHAVALAVASTLLSGAAAPAPADPSESAAPAKPSQPPWDLPSRRGLPPAARDLLSEKMERHADQMTLLFMSVVLLNYSAAESLADAVAREPRFKRPSQNEQDSLNTLLPKRLFALEEQLTRRAREVTQAAAARDQKKLVSTFGALAETCVACHSAYLYEDLDQSRR